MRVNKQQSFQTGVKTTMPKDAFSVGRTWFKDVTTFTGLDKMVLRLPLVPAFLRQQESGTCNYRHCTYRPDDIRAVCSLLVMDGGRHLLNNRKVFVTAPQTQTRLWEVACGRCRARKEIALFWKVKKTTKATGSLLVAFSPPIVLEVASPVHAVRFRWQAAIWAKREWCLV
jgi:hypothetical protein